LVKTNSVKEFGVRRLKRRFMPALVGSLLLVGTPVEAYFQSFGFYQEHYVWPREKYGVLTPLRWQDVAFQVMFWPVALGLFYLSYRLLRYAFRRQSSVAN
jgi:hypothetical protein